MADELKKKMLLLQAEFSLAKKEKKLSSSIDSGSSSSRRSRSNAPRAIDPTGVRDYLKLVLEENGSSCHVFTLVAYLRRKFPDQRRKDGHFLSDDEWQRMTLQRLSEKVSGKPIMQPAEANARIGYWTPVDEPDDPMKITDVYEPLWELIRKCLSLKPSSVADVCSYVSQNWNPRPLRQGQEPTREQLLHSIVMNLNHDPSFEPMPGNGDLHALAPSNRPRRVGILPVPFDAEHASRAEVAAAAAAAAAEARVTDESHDMPLSLSSPGPSGLGPAVLGGANGAVGGVAVSATTALYSSDPNGAGVLGGSLASPGSVGGVGESSSLVGGAHSAAGRTDPLTGRVRPAYHALKKQPDQFRSGLSSPGATNSATDLSNTAPQVLLRRSHSQNGFHSVYFEDSDNSYDESDSDDSDDSDVDDGSDEKDAYGHGDHRRDQRHPSAHLPSNERRRGSSETLVGGESSAATASGKPLKRGNQPTAGYHCPSCGSDRAGDLESARWKRVNGKFICLRCASASTSSRRTVCPICGEPYRRNASEEDRWIGCDDCPRWVMASCDGIDSLEPYDESNPKHLRYSCPVCRDAKGLPRTALAHACQQRIEKGDGTPEDERILRQSAKRGAEPRSNDAAEQLGSVITGTSPSSVEPPLNRRKEDALSIISAGVAAAARSAAAAVNSAAVSNSSHFDLTHFAAAAAAAAAQRNVHFPNSSSAHHSDVSVALLAGMSSRVGVSADDGAGTADLSRRRRRSLELAPSNNTFPLSSLLGDDDDIARHNNAGVAGSSGVSLSSPGSMALSAGRGRGAAPVPRRRRLMAQQEQELESEEAQLPLSIAATNASSAAASAARASLQLEPSTSHPDAAYLAEVHAVAKRHEVASLSMLDGELWRAVDIRCATLPAPATASHGGGAETQSRAMAAVAEGRFLSRSQSRLHSMTDELASTLAVESTRLQEELSQVRANSRHRRELAIRIACRRYEEAFQAEANRLFDDYAKILGVSREQFGPAELSSPAPPPPQATTPPLPAPVKNESRQTSSPHATEPTGGAAVVSVANTSSATSSSRRSRPSGVSKKEVPSKVLGGKRAHSRSDGDISDATDEASSTNDTNASRKVSPATSSPLEEPAMKRSKSADGLSSGYNPSSPPAAVPVTEKQSSSSSAPAPSMAPPSVAVPQESVSSEPSSPALTASKAPTTDSSSQASEKPPPLPPRSRKVQVAVAPPNETKKVEHSQMPEVNN